MNHETWSEAQAETTVTVDGHDLSLAYRDAGEGDPVLFLHGIPTWRPAAGLTFQRGWDTIHNHDHRKRPSLR